MKSHFNSFTQNNETNHSKENLLKRYTK